MTAHCIVDIDGTICSRSTHDVWKQHAGDWAKMREHCASVEPIPQMVDMVRELCWHYKVELITSRSEQLREVTIQWTKAQNINFWRLTMRSPTDTTPDHVAKIEWAKALDLSPQNVAFVLEDKPKVVAAWRAAGYICLQPCADHHDEDAPQTPTRRWYEAFPWVGGRFYERK